MTIRAYAIVDIADAAFVGQWRWSLDADGYAIRVGKSPEHNRLTSFKMHREILGIKHREPVDIDHINRNRLDNRRDNLRALPKGGNAQNMSAYPNTSSPHRGVTWSKNAKKWQAQTFANGKYRYLGYFDSEEEAAKAARDARARLLPYAVD